jgi:adenylate kinase
MTFDTIFFIGPQGSGKGTQARLLAEQLGFFYWEMGGILREVAKSGTELGNKVGALIDQGVLLTDDILLEVVKQKISDVPKEQGIIFDGIPRRLGQAQYLLDYLHSIGHQQYVTMFIDLPRTESLARLMKRAEVEHRKDDTEEKINFRLDQYEKDTLPVLDFLRGKSSFITIDGRPAIEEVTEAINTALQSQ